MTKTTITGDCHHLACENWLCGSGWRCQNAGVTHSGWVHTDTSTSTSTGLSARVST